MWVPVNFDDVVKPTYLDKPCSYMAKNVLDLQDVFNTFRHLLVKRTLLPQQVLPWNIMGWFNLRKKVTPHVQINLCLQACPTILWNSLSSQPLLQRGQEVSIMMLIFTCNLLTQMHCAEVSRGYHSFSNLILSQTCDHCNFMATNIHI